jgi:hypothetical protein
MSTKDQSALLVAGTSVVEDMLLLLLMFSVQQVMTDMTQLAGITRFGPVC